MYIRSIFKKKIFIKNILRYPFVRPSRKCPVRRSKSRRESYTISTTILLLLSLLYCSLNVKVKEVKEKEEGSGKRDRERTDDELVRNNPARMRHIRSRLCPIPIPQVEL